MALSICPLHLRLSNNHCIEISVYIEFDDNSSETDRKRTSRRIFNERSQLFRRS